MVAASVLDQEWLPIVAASPGPYLFSAEGVLVYLAQAPQVIARIAEQFPGALIAVDTYSQRDARAAAQDGGQKGDGCAVGVVV